MDKKQNRKKTECNHRWAPLLARAGKKTTPSLARVCLKCGELKIGEKTIRISRDRLNMGGLRIENLGAPDSDDDALRRDTIDSKIATHTTTDAHQPRSHDHSLALDGTPIALDGVPNLPASKITSEQFPSDRMPRGADGYILKGKGVGVNPEWEDPPAIIELPICNSNDPAHAIPQGATSYTKAKEIKLNAPLAKCRIKFDMTTDRSAVPVGYAKVYKNGSPIGAEHREGRDMNYVTITEDFANFNTNDLIQIYGYHAYYDYEYIRNFRLYYAEDKKPISTTNTLV